MNILKSVLKKINKCTQKIRKRDDDRYGGSVQLSFKYWDDRLDLTLNYRYLENDSNISLEDYEENRFFVQFSIVL